MRKQSAQREVFARLAPVAVRNGVFPQPAKFWAGLKRQALQGAAHYCLKELFVAALATALIASTTNSGSSSWT
jgi:hypothetical protein